MRTLCCLQYAGCCHALLVPVYYAYLALSAVVGCLLYDLLQRGEHKGGRRHPLLLELEHLVGEPQPCNNTASSFLAILMGPQQLLCDFTIPLVILANLI